MASYPNIDYLLVGHITADIVPGGRTLGGTPSYSAATLKSFGLRVGSLTSAATGDPLLEEFRQYAHVVALPARQTTTFENIYGPDGRRQYLSGVAAPITPADVPEPWISTPLVHISPMADEIAPQIVHIFPRSIKLLTLQGWLRRWDADGLVRFKRWFDATALKAFDIVVFSEEDIREAPDLEQEMAAVCRYLVVTRAEQGGTVYHDGGSSAYDAAPAQLVHPTGAGDVFAASLLAAYHLLDHDMGRALRCAAELAAISVTRFGLDSAPTPEEVRNALARVGYTR